MRLNIHFLIVFVIGCIAFVNDILIYVFDFNYLLGLCISALFCFFILAMCIKNKKINITLDFDKTDVFIYISMFFITIVSGVVYPDYVYDALSYHAYLQETPFMDKINFDFFPGRIYCIFLFPLGDRMFYIFRYFLGYRFGAILSFYLSIVLFYQVKNFLNILTNKNKLSKYFSYFIFLVYTYTSSVGNYHIDNFMIVFLLQGIIIIFSNENLFKEKFSLYVLALIFGISIGIKITSIFFVIVLLRIYNTKKI